MIALYVIVTGLIAFYLDKPVETKWKKIDTDVYVIVFIICMLIGWMVIPYHLVLTLAQKCRK